MKKNKVAFQGELGAYSHIAANSLFKDAEIKTCASFEEAFKQAHEDENFKIIIPIENSLAGRVADTQRLIPESNLKITSEYFLEVNHNLMGVKGSKISDIKRVHSHEQGIAQCRNKIINLNKQMIIQADTAGSAKMISELNNSEDAAIASELAARIYNLDIIESNFQDLSNNVTRFLIMQNKINEVDQSSSTVLTTLVFNVRSIPAALYKCLGGFASNGVNITKLESYVHPQGFDVAQFYIDFEGHPDEPSVKLALEEMKFFCKHLNILGVYEKSRFRKK